MPSMWIALALLLSLGTGLHAPISSGSTWRLEAGAGTDCPRRARVSLDYS
jgi:hypothetical protein